jgi:hypothetical protein
MYRTHSGRRLMAAQRTTVSGMRGAKALLSFTATWYVATECCAWLSNIWTEAGRGAGARQSARR